MKKKTLTARVLEARELLRGWDRRRTSAELAAELEVRLTPLHAAAETLPAPVMRKLSEITTRLQRLASGVLSADDIEALEILLLGIWIRLESVDFNG